MKHKIVLKNMVLLEHGVVLERSEPSQALLDTWDGALRKAEELGALSGRASEAKRRADELEAELDELRADKTQRARASNTTALEQLLHEIYELHFQYDALVLATAELRRDYTVAVAGLVRPGPVQVLPSGTPSRLVQDYRTLARSGLMDVQWYRNRYGDLIGSEVDPISHYLEQGWREGRQPGPMFDGVAYLVANPDIAALGVNPLVHYQTTGMFEFRPIMPVTGSGSLQRRSQTRAIRWSDPFRIIADLHSYEEFKAFRQNCPQAFEEPTEKAVLSSALTFGTWTEFMGGLGPEQTTVADGDTREGLMSGGLNSRTRAIADLLLQELRRIGKSPDQARIYGHEAVTYLATLMRRRFPCFLGTEYAPDDQAKRRLLPFIHNDICASQFPDRSFDATFSCDVLEHVPDRDAALREAARTTVPGGIFLATFPFFFEMEVGSVFAELKNGELVHHLETPIFHGNPVDEEGGSLVFEIPGWDIIERARRAGFSEVAMRFCCDEEKGVTASGEGRMDGPRGVFVLVAQR